jgi:hypothetical protein
MSFTAFPLRLRGSFLDRCDEARAILSLVEIMARTSHGSWPGSDHFGLREFFEMARQRPELPGAAVLEANLALQDLGLSGFRIENIEREDPVRRDEDRYVVTLISKEQQVHRHPLRFFN